MEHWRWIHIPQHEARRKDRTKFSDQSSHRWFSVRQEAATPKAIPKALAAPASPHCGRQHSNPPPPASCGPCTTKRCLGTKWGIWADALPNPSSFPPSFVYKPEIRKNSQMGWLSPFQDPLAPPAPHPLHGVLWLHRLLSWVVKDKRSNRLERVLRSWAPLHTAIVPFEHFNGQ